MPSGTACTACELTFPFKDLAVKPSPGPRNGFKYFCWKCHPDKTVCDRCRKTVPATVVWVAALPPHAVWCVKCIKKPIIL